MSAMTEARHTPPEVTLGWRLRMAMEHADFKADDMARELGVHRGTITRWTHDVGRPPRLIYLRQWAALCDVPFDWLEGNNEASSGEVTDRSVAPALAA